MRNVSRDASSTPHKSRTRKENPPPPSSSPFRGPTQATLAQELDSVLYLRRNAVSFNAPSKSESVFFDECNREVISLTSSIEPGKTRVIFQTTERDDRIEFRLPIEKRILSIKLNSSRTVLAYHVERNIMEFRNVHEILDAEGQLKYELEDKRYVQTSRAKNSKLIGFLWTGPMEIVIITDLSVEYYHVDSNRRRLKHFKLFQSSTNWFVYQPPILDKRSDSTVCDASETSSYSLLMVSTGSLGNSMQPYLFTKGQIIRLSRFEVEGRWHDSEKMELFERSITIAHLYDRVRLLVLQHESLNLKSRGAQIVLYTVDIETGITSKTHTLDLDVSGRFAINILDNLVIAHDQPSKSSFIFDIMIESTEKSDCPKHFVSLINSRPIRQLQLSGESSKSVEMYSLNWVFFQPNFIVDAKLGLLSTLQIDLSAMERIMEDNLLLLSFLAHRRNSESIILKKCRQIVSDSYLLIADSSGPVSINPLADVSLAFETIGKLVVSAPEFERKGPQDDNRSSSAASTAAAAAGGKQQSGAIVQGEATASRRPFGASLYQEDIQREVFKWLETEADEQQAGNFHFITSTLMEFIFVVQRHNKNVEFCIYEQLLRCLARGRRYFQIIQILRSKIFKDSKQLACLLLSMRGQYKPAAQLGLDMLHRLDCLAGLIEAIDLRSTESQLDSSAPSSIKLEQSLEI